MPADKHFNHSVCPVDSQRPLDSLPAQSVCHRMPPRMAGHGFEWTLKALAIVNLSLG